MFIDVSLVKKLAGKPLAFKVTADWPPLEYRGETISFSQPVTLEGTAVYTGKVFFVDGAISTKVQRLCGRCLQPVEENLKIPFSEEYVQVAEQDQGDSAAESEKGLGFRGNRLELDAQIQETLLLELPISALCREDCKGLCTICGQDRNVQECDCQSADLDPRLQVLQKLLKS